MDKEWFSDLRKLLLEPEVQKQLMLEIFNDSLEKFIPIANQMLLVIFDKMINRISNEVSLNEAQFLEIKQIILQTWEEEIRK